MEKLNQVIEFIRGKKTYIVAACAIVYGIYTKETEAVLLGFGLLGLRNGITTEISKSLTQKKR